MESLSSNATAAALMQFVQPEVQKYLEAVYAVAPVPGEYVRYRLHLATALPLDLLDAWFELRRKTSFYQDLSANASQNGPGPANEAGKPKFSLFGPFSDDLRSQARQDDGEGGKVTERPLEALTLQGSSDLSGPKAHPATVPDDSRSAPSKTDSDTLDNEAAAPSRFTESDLEVISSLVGLETLRSTQEHCGSTSLFLFEQLTALDSLDAESKAGSKRRRTRHQHFWRNTDKLDARERVYIPTSSIRPALSKNEPIVPKLDIKPDERTNAWTVCLTTQGVVSYLNKHISPLGVQVIRALQRQSKEVAKTQTKVQARSQSHNLDSYTQAEESPQRVASDAAVRISQGADTQTRAEPPELQGKHSQATENKIQNSQEPKAMLQGHEIRSSFRPVQSTHELIPRARRRKPNN